MSEALLLRRRKAAERRLWKAKQAEDPVPGWAQQRARAFTFVPGQERLQIRPSHYSGLTPVLDSFNDLDFPGWNPWEALELGRHFQACRAAGYAASAAAQETAALKRFLPGPLPRLELAQAFGLPLERVLAQAKRSGYWVRVRGDGPTPYEAAILKRLGEELGRQYLDEVAAETAAQLRLMQRWNLRSCGTKQGDHVGPEGSGWLVERPPFRACRPGKGELEWFAEVSCAAPGCLSNRIHVRTLESLRKSKSKGCRWCKAPASALLVRERSLQWDQAHIPLVLREPGLQSSYPLRAQGALRNLEAELTARERKPSAPQPVAPTPAAYDDWF